MTRSSIEEVAHFGHFVSERRVFLDPESSECQSWFRKKRFVDLGHRIIHRDSILYLLKWVFGGEVWNSLSEELHTNKGQPLSIAELLSDDSNSKYITYDTPQPILYEVPIHGVDGGFNAISCAPPPKYRLTRMCVDHCEYASFGPTSSHQLRTSLSVRVWTFNMMSCLTCRRSHSSWSAM